MTRPTLHLSFPSDPALIAAVRRAVEAVAEIAGLPVTDAADVGLCVNEAVANVIRHAYDGAEDQPVELTAEPHADRFVVCLRDWGSGKKPDIDASLPIGDAAADPATLRPGGLGLPCLKRLLDEAVFEPQPDGMRLRMVKRKRPEPLKS